MTITFGQILVWVIVGALGGALAGMVVRGKLSGFGRYGNVLLGMVGAVVGGFIFGLLNIDLGLGQITITFEDIIAAFLGSLLILFIIRYFR